MTINNKRVFLGCGATNYAAVSRIFSLKRGSDPFAAAMDMICTAASETISQLDSERYSAVLDLAVPDVILKEFSRDLTPGDDKGDASFPTFFYAAMNLHPILIGGSLSPGDGGQGIDGSKQVMFLDPTKGVVNPFGDKHAFENALFSGSLIQAPVKPDDAEKKATEAEATKASTPWHQMGMASRSGILMGLSPVGDKFIPVQAGNTLFKGSTENTPSFRLGVLENRADCMVRVHVQGTRSREAVYSLCTGWVIAEACRMSGQSPDYVGFAPMLRALDRLRNAYALGREVLALDTGALLCPQEASAITMLVMGWLGLPFKQELDSLSSRKSTSAPEIKLRLQQKFHTFLLRKFPALINGLVDAKIAGSSARGLALTANLESGWGAYDDLTGGMYGFRHKATNGSAFGTFQFLNSTWSEEVNRPRNGDVLKTPSAGTASIANQWLVSMRYITANLKRRGADEPTDRADLSATRLAIYWPAAAGLGTATGATTEGALFAPVWRGQSTTGYDVKRATEAWRAFDSIIRPGSSTEEVANYHLFRAGFGAIPIVMMSGSRFIRCAIDTKDKTFSNALRLATTSSTELSPVMRYMTRALSVDGARTWPMLMITRTAATPPGSVSVSDNLSAQLTLSLDSLGMKMARRASAPILVNRKIATGAAAFRPIADEGNLASVTEWEKVEEVEPTLLPIYPEIGKLDPLT